MGRDYDQIEEIKARLADRFTAAELVELLGIPVEDVIEEWWEYLLHEQGWILEEIGIVTDSEDGEEVG